MGGGLMQLVAYGAQDVYLSGNPQITFFKVVYRRHTNFSVEPIQQTWNGAADFGRTVTCNINRNGDLITNMYVAVKLNQVTPTTPWGYVKRLGLAMIQEYKVEIGGSKIDEQYGDWLNIWYELTHKTGQERGFAKMVGDDANLTNVSTETKRSYQMYVPLQFWFNRNNGLALPLIALQYHDVRITMIYNAASTLVNWTGSTQPVLNNLMADCYLLIDYVYLDSEERKRFAQASHEYLIEQLQFTGSESLTAASNKYRLNFNHPSKYLVWAPHLDRYNAFNQWLAYAYDGNWQNALDRFAKLLYIATRAPTSDVLGVNPFVGLVTAGGIYNVAVLPVAGGAAIGELFEGVQDPALVNSTIVAMLAKIECKFVAQSIAGPNADIAITPGVLAVGPATDLQNQLLLKELLNNTIIVTNNLTMEDISRSIAELTNTGVNSSILSIGAINVINYFNYGNFLDGTDNPVYNGKLQLNGQDRFQQRDGHYFNYVQPWQHFSNTPADGINVYSFALKPEDHQPTGTCNFSRIDNATLQVDVGLYNASINNYVSTYLGTNSNSLLNIYTVNYNVLRVMSGMAGTAYSN
jgi:hypothetical protein